MMKPLKSLLIIAVLSLNVVFAISVSAQNFTNLVEVLESKKKERADEVAQDNELEYRAESVGKFFDNPLQLDGQPLDYGHFNLGAEGKLTVIKGSALTGKSVQIPFYVYLRRNGILLALSVSKKKHMDVDLPTILKLAEPGDQLIIKPANKEDWQAKRILKLLGGC